MTHRAVPLFCSSKETHWKQHSPPIPAVTVGPLAQERSPYEYPCQFLSTVTQGKKMGPSPCYGPRCFLSVASKPHSVEQRLLLQLHGKGTAFFFLLWFGSECQRMDQELKSNYSCLCVVHTSIVTLIFPAVDCDVCVLSDLGLYNTCIIEIYFLMPYYRNCQFEFF